MKGKIIGVLSSAFILGLATSALAVHAEIPAETSPVIAKGNVQLIIDGSVRMRGYTQQDTVEKDALDGSEDTSGDKTGYDGRLRLGVKATIQEAVSGYIRLETGDTTKDVYGWGKNDEVSLYKGGTKDDNDLTVLEGWLQYDPGCVGVKVGHMPLSLGNKLFFDHTGSGDDAILVFADLAGGTHLAGGTIKLIEDDIDDDSHDLDMYFALMKQKSDALSWGANLAFLDNDEIGMRMWNLGLDATLNLGAFVLAGDIEYQGGELTDNGFGLVPGSTVSVDQDALAAQVTAATDVGAFNIGALVAYGTGHDADSTDDTENEEFFNFLTDTRYQTTIPGYRLAVPGMDHVDTGLANLTIFQLFGSTKTKCFMTGKDLALKARVSMISLTEEIYTYGTTKDDDVGVELELFATWKIANGLTYSIETAYLATGDAWKTSATEDPDNAYFLRHALNLSF